MKTKLNQLRINITRNGARLLSAPYLPDGLVWLTLFLIMTDASIILASQPAIYWIDNSRAETLLPFVSSLLALHPLVFLGALLAVLLVIWAVLSLLNRSAALVIWAGIAFLNLMRIISAIEHQLGFRLSLGGEAASGQAIMDMIRAGVAGLMIGLALAILLLRRNPPATVARSRPWILRPQPLLSLVWLAVLTSTVLWMGTVPKSGWQLMHPEHTPGKRSSAAVAYDSARSQAVLFGGVTVWLGSQWDYKSDTWIWDGKDWNTVEGHGAPGPRRAHTMAYDEQRGMIVLFGGEGESGPLSDTWEWDGEQWNYRWSEVYPPARLDHQMYFDPQRGKTVLLGGMGSINENGQAVFYNDAWEWDGEVWQEIQQTNEPLTVANTALAYDLAQQRAVNFSHNYGTMFWQDAGWTVISLNPEPIRRVAARIAARSDGRLILFGGVDGSGNMNDTWLFSDETWQQMDLQILPPVRNVPILFYDPVIQKFVLYGGVNNDGALEDMWSLAIP